MATDEHEQRKELMKNEQVRSGRTNRPNELEGFEVAAKITGAGAKNIAIRCIPFSKKKRKPKAKQGWRVVLASQSDYLVFIDGDCIPHRQFLEEHLAFRKSGQVMCGRRVLLTAKVSDKLSAKRIQKRYLSYPVFFDLLWETLFCGKKTYLEQMIHIRSEWLRQLVIKERQRYILGCNFSPGK